MVAITTGSIVVVIVIVCVVPMLLIVLMVFSTAASYHTATSFVNRTMVSGMGIIADSGTVSILKVSVLIGELTAGWWSAARLPNRLKMVMLLR